eukprot:gene8624-10214_t
MTDRRTSKRKSDAEPKASTTKKARAGSSTSLADSLAESHDDATQTTNLDENGAEIHWEWENEEEVITRTTITEERIIALRSKIIATPIQRSVLAVSHIYSHGRPLQDGDIGRLVNADEDEVVEVHSDEESEISTPRRRLYQRSSTSGTQSGKRDTASARRTSRVTGADDETTSEHHSSTSRSSRRSTANAAATTSSAALQVGSSRRSTSSAATTAALTLTAPIVTPSGRGGRRTSRASTVLDSAPSTPRSTRSSRASSPAHSPARSVSSVATGRGSTASAMKRVTAGGKGKVAAVASAAEAPLAPLVLAFNQQNQIANDLRAQQDAINDVNNNDNNNDNYNNNDYNGDYNEPIVDPRAEDPVRTVEEESWITHAACAVKSTLLLYTKPIAMAAVVLFIYFAVVYLRSAPKILVTPAAPLVSSAGQFNFTHVGAERHTDLADPAIASLQSQLDAQREQLLQVNDLVKNSRVMWDKVVQQADEQASAEILTVHNQTLEAINALADDASLLDAHLGELANTAHRDIAQMEQNLTSLRTLGSASFDAVLQELTPAVANLTLKAQELDGLVKGGVQVLQEVIHSFPHFDAAAIVVETEMSADGGTFTMENVINLAKETVEHISTVSETQEHTNTLLHEQIDTLSKTVEQTEHDLHNTEAAYQTAKEAYQQQVDEAVLDIDTKQQASVLSAQESLVVAAAAARAASDVQRARMYTLAQRAAQEQEAQRLFELEEAANSVRPLPPAEVEILLQSMAEPVLGEMIPALLKQHQQQVDTEVDKVYNNEMETQQKEIDKTLRSPAVKHAVQNIVSAQPETTTATSATATATAASASPDHLPGQDDDLLLPHNYAYGPRGGKVVHPRHFLPISPKNSKDKRLTTPAYTSSTSNSKFTNVLSFSAREKNTHHTNFPRVAPLQCVVSHLRPSLTDFYPLPMEPVVSESLSKYRSQGSSVSKALSQITVEMHNRVFVHSVKLIHAAKNRSFVDPDDLSNSREQESTAVSELQACAPERVRLIGWTLDPLNTASVSVDLGTYRFDSFTPSNDYALSEMSTANVSVYEQVFDITEHLRQHNSALLIGNTMGPALKAVSLQVLSNYGEPNFTCVHRLQVIGVLEDVIV